MGITRESCGRASTDLVKAVVSLRSIKDAYEIAEIEKMVNVAREMHITVCALPNPRKEAEIAGSLKALPWLPRSICISVILSKHGEILHNHCMQIF